MTSDQLYAIKEGDWFTIDNVIYKVNNISWRGAWLDAHEMIYDGGEYIESGLKVFLLKFIKAYGEVYTPYEEETV